LEATAAASGRWLLTLDTRTGDAAEKLYRGEGWQEAGRIPAFARGIDGNTHGTTIFWKRIG